MPFRFRRSIPHRPRHPVVRLFDPVRYARVLRAISQIVQARHYLALLLTDCAVAAAIMW